MVQSLEQYVAEATNAYKPAQTAIQTQLDALAGQLNTANEQINRNYAQQQAGLNRQRNMAAETASMQAAGSGGSFGGAANLANRKYYDQSFVPAVTQLRANQTNELAQARQNSENQRTSLNSQLSSLQAQANERALAQYYADQQQEKQLALQREQLAEQRRASEAQLAAQNAYNNFMMQAYKEAEAEKKRQEQELAANARPQYKNWNFGNGYYLQGTPLTNTALYIKDGKAISAGEFLKGTGANGANWTLWNDVWNNGISTNGVGSDTVEAFNRKTPSGSQYNYLF